MGRGRYRDETFRVDVASLRSLAYGRCRTILIADVIVDPLHKPQARHAAVAKIAHKIAVADSGLAECGRRHIGAFEERIDMGDEGFLRKHAPRL